jgi:hypothetical protein
VHHSLWVLTIGGIDWDLIKDLANPHVIYGEEVHVPHDEEGDMYLIFSIAMVEVSSLFL